MKREIVYLHPTMSSALLLRHRLQLQRHRLLRLHNKLHDLPSLPLVPSCHRRKLLHVHQVHSDHLHLLHQEYPRHVHLLADRLHCHHQGSHPVRRLHAHRHVNRLHLHLKELCLVYRASWRHLLVPFHLNLLWSRTLHAVVHRLRLPFLMRVEM